jgi:hypothetical protein
MVPNVGAALYSPEGAPGISDVTVLAIPPNSAGSKAAVGTFGAPKSPTKPHQLLEARGKGSRPVPFLPKIKYQKCLARLGSSATRNASPSELKASAENRIASPGA